MYLSLLGYEDMGYINPQKFRRDKLSDEEVPEGL